jgi:hypothetical protein
MKRIKEFVFDQPGLPNALDPVIGCISDKAVYCLDCGHFDVCKWTGAIRREVI